MTSPLIASPAGDQSADRLPLIARPLVTSPLIACVFWDTSNVVLLGGLGLILAGIITATQFR